MDLSILKQDPSFLITSLTLRHFLRGGGGVSQTYHMTEILLANSVKSKILKIDHIFAIFMKFSVALNFGFRTVVFKGRREIHLKSLSIPYAVFLSLHCERGVCMTIA